MRGGRRVLHLVRETRLPGPLADSAAEDTVVFLRGPPPRELPPCRWLVLGPAGEGAPGVEVDGLVDLLFAHDVVMTW